MPIRSSTRFSEHALERVKERLSLSIEEVAAILDHDLAVFVGIDEYSNRHRRLFFSVPDNNFFIAIQDADSGEVVTILPLEYHLNLRGFVSENDAVEAAAKMGRAVPDVWKLPGVMPSVVSNTVVISVTGLDSDGMPKNIGLGTWKDRVPEDLSLLVEDPLFAREIAARALAKGISLAQPLNLRLRRKRDKNGEIVDATLNPSAIAG
jgi:hypothetical protein